MHAVAHHLNAAVDCGALLLMKTGGHSHDPLHVAHQIALGRERAVREPWLELAHQQRRFLPAVHHGSEALQESEGFGSRQRRLVLDRVGDPAQQIGAGHRGPQARRQLGNRERKRARHVGEYLLLVDLVGHAGIETHEESATPREQPGSHRAQGRRALPKRRQGLERLGVQQAHPLLRRRDADDRRVGGLRPLAV